MNQLDLEQTATASPPATELEWPVERVIVPAKRRLKVSDLVRHADVIRVIAGRDFKVKYKQSVLGPLWLVFQPLALLLAFIIAFQNLTKVGSSGVPYVVFTLVGLSAWSFFQAAVTIGASSIISNHELHPVHAVSAHGVSARRRSSHRCPRLRYPRSVR